jgi:starch synthase
MQVYFIDNEDYFQRKFVLNDADGKEFEDNDERAIFFARGVLETVIKLRWAPDIIHCHGWLTSLVPLYIKKYFYNDPLFKDSKVITSVYDDSFKNSLNPEFNEKLLLEGITGEDISVIKDPNYVNLCKLGINYSDAVIKGMENINADIENHIKSSDKQFLDFQPEDTYIDAYNNFYDEVC